MVLPSLSLLSQKAVVPWLLIVAVAACAVVWRAERRLPVPDRAIATGFAALLLWSSIASFWGFDPTGSLFLVLRIGAMCAAALILFAIARGLDDRIRENLGPWLLAGILVALAIMIVEIALNFPIFEIATGERADITNLINRLNRGATAMAMMVWPAAAVLWRRGRIGAALLLCATVMMVLSQTASGAAILGAVAGGLMAALALTHRRVGRALLVVATIVVLAGSTLAANELARHDWQNAEWLVSSARHRVDIWNYTADLIAQKPLTGWGFDASRAVTKARPAENAGKWQMLPLHPHNAPLQILFELGAIGAAIVFVLLMLLVGRIEGLSKPARVCGQALFMSTLAIACTAYGLWQNQWLATMFSVVLLIPLTTPALAKPPARGAVEDSPPGAQQ